MTNSSNIFFAPVSSSDLSVNFEKTVVTGVPIKSIDIKFTKHFRKNDDIVRLWGIRDAKKGTFDKTKSNDVVFFYKQRIIIGYGVVDKIFTDEELSKSLWGIFENKIRGEKYLWSNIILFKNYYECSIDFSEFISLAKYSEKFSVRGYMKFNDTGLSNIINKFKSVQGFIDSFKAAVEKD